MQLFSGLLWIRTNSTRPERLVATQTNWSPNLSKPQLAEVIYDWTRVCLYNKISERCTLFWPITQPTFTPTHYWSGEQFDIFISKKLYNFMQTICVQTKHQISLSQTTIKKQTYTIRRIQPSENKLSSCHTYTTCAKATSFSAMPGQPLNNDGNGFVNLQHNTDPSVKSPPQAMTGHPYVSVRSPTSIHTIFLINSGTSLNLPDCINLSLHPQRCFEKNITLIVKLNIMLQAYMHLAPGGNVSTNFLKSNTAKPALTSGIYAYMRRHIIRKHLSGDTQMGHTMYTNCNSLGHKK
jgi:hypothetical protein